MPDSSAPRRTGFALPGTRRRRIGAGLAVIAASAAAIGIVLGAGPSSSQGASAPAKSSGAATVSRRDLVATDTESGTLGYANPQTVFNRLSGTITSLPAVGKVINPGQTLYDVDSNPVVLFNGTTPAYRDLSAGVSNGLDVYELKQDLKALGFDPDHQITVNQTFDAASTAAVERWQASIGQTQTGTVTLGQIVFLPGPQRITQVETVLGSTGGASGASGSGSTASASTAAVRPRAEFVDLTTHAATPKAPATKVSAKSTNDATTTTKSTTTTCPTSLTKPSTGQTTTSAAIAATKNKIAALCREQATANSMTAQQTLAALIALLKAETAQLRRSSGSAASGTGASSGKTGSAGGASARSSSSGSGGGSSSGGSSSGGSSGGGSSAGGGSSSAGSTSSGSASGSGTAQAILQTTSTQLVVSVQLDATKQSEAVVGEPVTVELPNGNTEDGKITGVSPVAQSASSSSSSSGSGGGGGGSSSSTPSSTVPVTITLKGHQSATGLDQAAVSVNFEQQVENNVLSVPVTALLATSGGGYALQESSAPGRMIPVTPGLFAAGFVQISGAGIYPGLQVTDSQG